MAQQQQKDLSTLHNHIEKQQNSLSTLEKLLTEQGNNVGALHERLSVEIKKLEDNLKTHDDKLNVHAQSITNIQNEHKTTKQQHGSIIQQIREQLDDCVSQQKTAGKSISDITSITKKLLQASSTLKEKTQSHDEKIEGIHKSIDTKTKPIDEKTSKHEEKIHELEGRLVSIINTLEDKTSNLNTMLTSTQQTYKYAFGNFKEDIEKNHREILRLKSTIQEQKESDSGLGHTVIELKSSIDKLANDFSCLEDNLKVQENASKNISDNYKQKVKSILREQKHMQEEISMLKRKIVDQPKKEKIESMFDSWEQPSKKKEPSKVQSKQKTK